MNCPARAADAAFYPLSFRSSYQIVHFGIKGGNLVDGGQPASQQFDRSRFLGKREAPKLATYDRVTAGVNLMTGIF